MSALLPDELSPGTCPAAWTHLSSDAALGLPYYAQHGSPTAPHECAEDRHDPLIPHRCRCGRRERFAT